MQSLIWLTFSTLNGFLMVFDHNGSGNGWAIGQAPSHWSNASELYVSSSIVHFVLSKNCSWLVISSVVTRSVWAPTTSTRHRFAGNSCTFDCWATWTDHFGAAFNTVRARLPDLVWLLQTSLFGWVLGLSHRGTPRLVFSSQLGHSLPHRPTVGTYPPLFPRLESVNVLSAIAITLGSDKTWFLHRPGSSPLLTGLFSRSAFFKTRTKINNESLIVNFNFNRMIINLVHCLCIKLETDMLDLSYYGVIKDWRINLSFGW